jgi:general secretion pathway protein J
MRRFRAVHAGFTLLELLVALAIFALLSVMSYGGLNTVLRQRAVTEVEAGRLAEVQKIYMLMQRDLEQIILRPVRGEYGDTLPALSGGDGIQFTRGGWNNPLGHPRSNLQRVGYAMVDGHLTRYVWIVLDRAQDTQPLEQPLSDQVTALDVRYLDDSDEWLTAWPNPAKVAAAGGVPVDELPRAVEITLTHRQYGTLVWLFRMPDS